MSEKSERAYLLDILKAVGLIEQFMSGHDLTYFRKTPLLSSAVIRQLEIIGEASKRISLDTQKSYPSIPWSLMSRTRDKLIHAYSGVDLDIIFNIATIQLPKIKKDLQKVLRSTVDET